MRISWFGLYCGMMLTTSAMSIDILLPAFTGLSASLSVSSQKIQLVVPVYIFALGVAHPVFGALADCYGRKPVIYLGLLVYLVGTLICLFSRSLEVMLLGRFLQGFGGATGSVVCRAMMRDRYQGDQLSQHMAIASMFFAIGPVLAPLLGYVIYSFVGWRGIFIFLTLFAAGLAYGTSLQPETLSVSARKTLSWRNTKNNFSLVFKQRQSRYFTLVGACCTCLIVTFLEHAPVVYEQLGADGGQFVALFALSSFGIVIGQIVNHRMIKLWGTLQSTRWASTLVCFTTLVILLCVWQGVLSAWLFAALMTIFHGGFLIIFSNLVSLALDPHPQRAGTASAVFGFSCYFVGAIAAALITWIANESIVRWSVCFFAISLLIATSVRAWRAAEYSAV